MEGINIESWKGKFREVVLRFDKCVFEKNIRGPSYSNGLRAGNWIMQQIYKVETLNPTLLSDLQILIDQFDSLKKVVSRYVNDTELTNFCDSLVNPKELSFYRE
jgi:hypothetical protein